MTFSDPVPGWGPSRWRILALVGFLLFVGIRLGDLGADLPSYFDTGISITDEGTYMDAPKKKVQTGEWNLPGEWWQSQKLVPLFSWSLRGWFSTWGVGLVEGRSLSVCLGILTLGLVWLTGRRLGGDAGGTALLVMVGSSYILTHFNRAAMVETMQLFFVWILALSLTWQGSIKRDIVCGLAMTATVLVKLSGAIALPGIVLWWLFGKPGGRGPGLRHALALGAGLLFPLVMTELVLPGFLLEAWNYMNTNYGGLLNVGGGLWHFIHIPVRGMFISREAIVILLALLALFMASGRRDFSSWRPYLWGFLGSVALASCLDLAVRRYLLFMPWLYLLALYGWLSHSRPEEDAEESRDPLLGLGQGVMLVLAGTGVPMVLGHFQWIAVKYWVALGCLLGGSWLLYALFQRGIQRATLLELTPKARRWCLVLCLVMLGIQQGRWWLMRTHHTQNAATAVATVLEATPKGMLLVGNIAPMLAIESDRQAMFLIEKMMPITSWALPQHFYFITYTQPKLGYNEPADRSVFELAKQMHQLGEWPMFSENSIQRRIALFEVTR